MCASCLDLENVAAAAIPSLAMTASAPEGTQTQSIQEAIGFLLKPTDPVLTSKAKVSNSLNLSTT